MIGTALTVLVGSVILLAAVGLTIWQCVKRSGDYPWYGRVALTVLGVFVVSGVVGVVLSAVGLSVDDNTNASAELREELHSAGYTSAESDCVERALIREFGSVEAVADAEDSTAALVPMMMCKGDIGMDTAMIECWTGELVEYFDIDRFDANAMSDVADAMSDPEHRRFATVASLTCQGLPKDASECIFDTVANAHPEVLSDSTPGQTAEQQRWLLDAAGECGVS